MKKITMSLITMSLLTIGASANEYIIDDFGNTHNLGVLTGFQHIGDSNVDLYTIGVNNRIDSKECNLDLYVSGYVAIAPSTSEMSSASFLNIGAGVISPSIEIWHNKVEAFAGLELQNEFGTSVNNNVIINLQPEIGVIVNERLTVSYKQYETDFGNSATLNISYKF